MTTNEERDRPTGSFNSFGPIKKKNKEIKCSSQTRLKPNFGLAKLKEKVMKIVCKRVHSKSLDPTGPEPEDFTLDQSKLILRDIAHELDRIVQTRDLSLSTKITEDESSLEERQAFLLQLAQDITPQATFQEINRPTGLANPCGNVPEKNRGGCLPEPEQDKSLKKAFGDLSTWTWTLKEMEEDSVCLEKDVREIVKDLRQQWKKGKLTNILPVLSFVIWSISQPNGQKGSILKHWNRNIRLFKSRGAQHVPDSVWKLIMKTTAVVRLDESTAHPYLELSPDMRAVKMKRIVESVEDPMVNYRRTKEQFDGWPCVLGSEGFVSGTHYWEVDVRDKAEWRIGVVSEFATRNSFKDLSTAAGYWTLKLQLGQLLAMTVPVTKLDRHVPSVLGVFLDVEEGQVSFYDVGQRSHIFSFHVSFDGNKKVFPVFGTVEIDKEMHIVK